MSTEDMNDELRKMEQAFKGEGAAVPREDARRAAIVAAMERFDEENSEVRQENSLGRRLMVRGKRLLHIIKFNAIKRKQAMKSSQLKPWRSKLTYTLAGGATLAAAAIVVINSPLVQRADYSQAALPLQTGVMLGKPASSGQERQERRRSGQAQVEDQNHLEYAAQGRDNFSSEASNPVRLVNEHPVSTFSVDVDTASYAFMRASINGGHLPHKDSVRVEEMINYFDYDYQGPKNKAQPFKANVAVMQTPWNKHTKLLRIGIKAYQFPQAGRPHANLVFLIDTSGSMDDHNKLPLLINSFKLLLQSLQPTDTVAIVTYAGSVGTVLQPTKVSDKAKILAALDNLDAGGSTAGGEGIRQAYQLAEQRLREGGVNRVILATDGDFNVGFTDEDELKGFVERKRETGVSLSVLGFGMGNYNDSLMQTLAQNGNGNAAYIDSLSEARKTLVEEAGSTLFTVAKDVKLQLEFNPAMVGEYRLIGYETRVLDREDFNNDKVDGGDIGAGHTVTALYEFAPVGSNGRLVDELRYQKPAVDAASVVGGDEYAFLKIRYKLPQGDSSVLITTPVAAADEVSEAASASKDARFAAAVAAFGQLLRGGEYTGDFSYDDVVELAMAAKGADTHGYRAEFINLVRDAKLVAALQPLSQ